MKVTIIIARVLLGLAFVVFGLNIIHPFMPQPPIPEGTPTAHFMAAMGPTHWMMLIGFFQLAGGLLVLLGKTAPLGLAVLAPILVNVLAFHIFLQDGADIAPGLVFTVLEIFLVYAYRSHFRALFTTSASPA